MTENRECSLGARGLAFVTGGLVGAGLALLLAPQSGRETWEQLRGRARRAGDDIHEAADKAAQVLEQTAEKDSASSKEAGAREEPAPSNILMSK